MFFILRMMGSETKELSHFDDGALEPQNLLENW
jgi:hypothetical protein